MKLNTAIILAGGKSRRMGFDKQLIKIQGEYIVDHIGKKLKNHFEEIIVVTNTPELYDKNKYKLVKDIYLGYGPLAGIHIGLLNSNSEGAYVTACDMPYICDKYIKYLKKLYEDNKPLGIVSEKNGYIEPMAGVYSKELLLKLEEKLEKKDLKIKTLIKEENFLIIPEEKILEFEKEIKIFSNINTLEELNSQKIEAK